VLHGVPTERVVRFGEPAPEILVEADAWDADLIVVADRRASGWWPRRRGISAQVSSRATVPVLRYQERRTR
jgi:nucleotide-binding universal stress UspA family protein